MPPWPLIAVSAANLTLSGPGTSVTPVDSAANSITGYVLGYGPIGILVLALGWLAFKGWRLVSPAREADVRDTARADLLKELNRVLAEKAKAEEERDEALRIARDQLVPVLVAFNASVSALLPILQEMAGRQGGHDRGTRRT